MNKPLVFSIVSGKTKLHVEVDPERMKEDGRMLVPFARYVLSSLEAFIEERKDFEEFILLVIGEFSS